ncbi:MAG: hypothetical protein L6Q98_11445 [Anaerolineae bacterium]|nr:hypothetical protein [Anaerolineae bacterium]NUQ05567.1 hypothetical protein [Anaerolineae bacterium]
MSSLMPRKRMVHAHGRKMVIAQGLRESAEHVIMTRVLDAEGSVALTVEDVERVRV